jgi:hypothetical protein
MIQPLPDTHAHRNTIAKSMIYGAGNRIRTYDPRITNALLYQLSYPGIEGRGFYSYRRCLSLLRE